jgi:uncharacterized protein YbjT (DUF2867 family)
MGLCLVTGATGYVGGRLAPRLREAGHSVRCLTRSAKGLRDVPWAAGCDIVEGDLLDPAAARAALDGVDVAYYLVHSLGSPSFEDVDRRAAANFAVAARAAGVRRVVYLGGPVPRSPVPRSPARRGPHSPDGEPDRDLSAHMRSRAEVGRILLKSGVPTVVLRAAVIIGSGSASFEMLRYLTERLPVMVTPHWVHNRVQPIAIRDVLRYLVAWASVPADVHRAFDIGGPDVLTYKEMMSRYAAVAGLPRRVILPIGVLTPHLSSYWVGLVTPVPSSIARPLVESLLHEAVTREHDISEYVPDPSGGLIGFDTAVRLALSKVGNSDVETRWSTSAWTQAPAEPIPTDPSWSGGSRYLDRRERHVDAPAHVLWSVIESIGGSRGWYSFSLAWSVRGLIDRLLGGVGLKRGRRDPHRLRVGEAVDFWRVEEIEPGRLLRLRAEMRLPGRAWLELRVTPDGSGSRYEQRALFLPKGLAGHLYWNGIAPWHALVFGGMADNIARTAEGWFSPSSPEQAAANPR